MKLIELKGLSDKHRDILRMRYRYRWRLTRIALEMGTSKQAVSKMLQHIQTNAGLSKPMRISVLHTKPRIASTQQLSTVYNY